METEKQTKNGMTEFDFVNSLVERQIELVKSNDNLKLKVERLCKFLKARYPENIVDAIMNPHFDAPVKPANGSPSNWTLGLFDDSKPAVKPESKNPLEKFVVPKQYKPETVAVDLKRRTNPNTVFCERPIDIPPSAWNHRAFHEYGFTTHSLSAYSRKYGFMVYVHRNVPYYIPSDIIQAMTGTKIASHAAVVAALSNAVSELLKKKSNEPEEHPFDLYLNRDMTQ